MLSKSVTLNLAIAERYGKKLRLGIYVILCVMCLTLSVGRERDGLIMTTVVAALGIGICTGILFAMLKELFDQSLFGEDAYTYMLFPFSSRDVILGKLLAALYWLTWWAIFASALIVYLYLWTRDLAYGVTSWDLHIPETLIKDLNLLTQFLFQQSVTAKAAAFLIATLLIQILLALMLLCTELQAGVILCHIHHANGKNAGTRILVLLGCIVIFAGCLYLPTWIFTLCTGGMITILPMILTMGIEILCSGCFVRWSIRKLETKYELN